MQQSMSDDSAFHEFFSPGGARGAVSMPGLPAWIRDALAAATPRRTQHNRDEPRQQWVCHAVARLCDDPGASPLHVKIFNVSPQGIGLISRTEMRDRESYMLTPEDMDGDPVPVRVVHCTQTVHGFKVGCRFDI